MKFQIKFDFLTQPAKNPILRKKPEVSLKVGFFEIGKKFISLMCYFWVYIMHHSCLYDSAKTTCFGKSYKLNYSRPIRLQYFWYHKNFLSYRVPFLNVSWKSQFDHAIFLGFSQACPDIGILILHAQSMFKLLWNKSAIQILKKHFVYQCDFLVLNDTPQFPLGIYENHMAVKNLVL